MRDDARLPERHGVRPAEQLRSGEPAVHVQVSARPAAVMAAIVAASLGACGDLKHADDEPFAPPAMEAGTDGASPGDANGGDGPTGDAGDSASGDGAAAEGFGPGPHGSLPSGYCCTSDDECRYRHCVDTGGGNKMCLDECAKDLFCTRPDITFTCDPSGSPRLCRPSAGFACLPAASFERGKRALGACCNATAAPNNDGTAGSECEGNQCASVGTAPLVCTHRCAFQADCPKPGYACVQFGTSKACVPTSSSYTCE
jgi:hypothetical protein